MKLFVTGGTGFIGSHFLNAALEKGHEIVALRRSADSRPRAPLVRDPMWLDKSMPEVGVADLAGCEALVHLAAYGVGGGMDDWEKCFQINVVESLQLWRQAADAGISRFIICGSCFEYGRSGERFEFIPVAAPLEPTGAYHASKASATMAALALAHEKALELIVLRPFHVYGEGEAPGRFWPSLVAAARAGEDLPMTAGTQVRDFTPVARVAEEFLHFCDGPELSQGVPLVRNLGTGRPCSLREFAESWWTRLGASGCLLPGVIPQRPNEVMRYVPLI